MDALSLRSGVMSSTKILSLYGAAFSLSGIGRVELGIRVWNPGFWVWGVGFGAS